MISRYLLLNLSAAFYIIFFIKTGEYFNSIALGFSCAYIMLVMITHFKPFTVTVINNNDFKEANVLLKVNDEAPENDGVKADTRLEVD